MPARFGVGDSVTVKRMAPAGTTGARATSAAPPARHALPGGWPHASGDGPPEATYTVRFAMADLWGDDAEPGWLYIDLWERYLE